MTCNTLNVSHAGTTTPIMAGDNNLLTYPTVDTSTGQVEIKCVTSDQGPIKGLSINQKDVRTLGQEDIKGDQKDVKCLVSGQGDVKDPIDGQKEIKGDISFDINNHNSNDHQNAINTSNVVVKSENKEKHTGIIDDDDNDFKPSKKKYRVLGVSHIVVTLVVLIVNVY